MEKANKPLPGCAYPNEHDPRDLYCGRHRVPPPSAATLSVVTPPPARAAAHRKLSDYCGIFAEKTNRIGKNVGNFMQSRGLLPIRRSVDETPRGDAPRSNGDVIRSEELPRDDDDRPTTAQQHSTREGRYEIHGDYERPRTSCDQKKRGLASYSAYGTYPRESRVNNARTYVHRANETEPRRSRRREYAANYDGNDNNNNNNNDENDDGSLAWRDVARGPSVSKPILRNGINHGEDERLYRSAPPRRSRTINFKDQTTDGGSPVGMRRAYPKSLRDLTDLELDDVAYLVPPDSRGSRANFREERLDDYRRREDRRGNEPSFDDDYLRLCRNLARLDGYPRGGGRYEPGQVHYERECRTFGKDTVAFIYYKTCYL